MALASRTHRTSVNFPLPFRSAGTSTRLYTLVGSGPSHRACRTNYRGVNGLPLRRVYRPDLGSIVTPGAVTRPRTGAMAAMIASATQSIRSSLAPAVRRTVAIAAAVVLIAIASLLVSDKRASAGDVSPAMRPWVVQDLKGAAFSRPRHAGENQWQALRTGARIEPGSIVRTDDSGRTELTNGIDTIRLSPSSEIELPAGRSGDPVTRVIHWIGTAFFHVGKRPGPQFEVDTPYIVAIVKGTKFTTTVSDAGAGIKVSEGIVGVSATAGGASIDVTAGGSASVSAAHSDTVTPGGPSGDATPAGGRGKGSALARAGDGP